ncbi:MAG: hypothetical protein HY696_04320 [Deltaproteobacteria bacterium]|nr:hypothetical protein [Deltaproteobacteria bacterium]
MGIPELPPTWAKANEYAEQQLRAAGYSREADAVRKCREEGGPACASLMTQEEAYAAYQQFLQLVNQPAAPATSTTTAAGAAVPLAVPTAPTTPAPAPRWIPRVIPGGGGVPTPTPSPGPVGGAALTTAAAAAVVVGAMLYIMHDSAKYGNFLGGLEQGGKVLLPHPGAPCLRGCHNEGVQRRLGQPLTPDIRPPFPRTWSHPPVPPDADPGQAEKARLTPEQQKALRDFLGQLDAPPPTGDALPDTDTARRSRELAEEAKRKEQAEREAQEKADRAREEAQEEARRRGNGAPNTPARPVPVTPADDKYPAPPATSPTEPVAKEGTGAAPSTQPVAPAAPKAVPPPAGDDDAPLPDDYGTDKAARITDPNKQAAQIAANVVAILASHGLRHVDQKAVARGVHDEMAHHKDNSGYRRNGNVAAADIPDVQRAVVAEYLAAQGGKAVAEHAPMVDAIVAELFNSAKGRAATRHMSPEQVDRLREVLRDQIDSAQADFLQREVPNLDPSLAGQPFEHLPPWMQDLGRNQIAQMAREAFRTATMQPHAAR